MYMKEYEEKKLRREHRMQTTDVYLTFIILVKISTLKMLCLNQFNESQTLLFQLE